MKYNLHVSIKSGLYVAMLATFLSLPLITPVAHAEAAREQQMLPPMLTVNGSAERQVNPDYAVLSLGVTTQGATVSEAKQANDKIMSATLSRLYNLGIAKADTKTSYFSVSPNSTYIPNTNEHKVSGYTVSNTLAIKINDLNKVSSVIDGTTSSGVTNINSLNFYNNKEQELDDQLTREAIQNARHKADVIAGALNSAITSVRSVSVGDYNRQYDTAMEGKFMVRALSTSTPIESGTITIRKQVSIVYALQQ